MKITTWNVNGLRALLRKKGWDWIAQYKPDVVCLQEIKAQKSQLEQSQLALIETYHSFWNPAEKKGYSGTLTLTKSPEVRSDTGLGVDRFDHEGRTIRTEFEDFILFNIYFPNGGRFEIRMHHLCGGQHR